MRRRTALLRTCTFAFVQVALVMSMLLQLASHANAQDCGVTASIEILPSGANDAPTLMVDPAFAGASVPEIDLVGAPPDSDGVLIVSSQSVATFIPKADSVLYPTTPWRIRLVHTDANGMSPLFGDFAGTAVGCGITLIVQVAVADDDRGYVLSDAVRLDFGFPPAAAAPALIVPAATPATSVLATGTGSAPGYTIRIAGGATTVETSVAADRSYSVSVPLEPDAMNMLAAVEVDFAAGQSLPSTATVIQDSTPPAIFMGFPTPGAVIPSASGVEVAGSVSDTGGALDALSVTINGVPAMIAPSSATTATFFASGIRLPGVGVQSLTATAEDAVGNVSTTTIDVAVVEPVATAMLQLVDGGAQTGPVDAQLPIPITVRLTGVSGQPILGQLVTFEVTRSNGRVAIAPREPAAPLRQVATDAEGLANVWWTLGSDAGVGNQRLRVTTVGGAFLDVCASALAAAPDRLLVASGDEQRAAAGATLPRQLSVFVSDGRNGVAGVPITFVVELGDGSLVDPGLGTPPAREILVVSGPTGHAEASWTLGPAPGANVVRASVDGGSAVLFRARGLSTNLGSTIFSGIIGDPQYRQLAGVQVDLDFGEGVVESVISDVTGRFLLAGLGASGPAALVVHGATATGVGGGPVPRSIKYPELEFDVFVTEGAANELGRAVLLPAVSTTPAGVYDGSTSIVLPFPSVVDARFVIVEGTEARHPDGTLVTPESPLALTVAQVPVHEVPMRFSDGASPPNAWSLQPSGATFDPPLVIELPNLSGEPPGAVLPILSFDHDVGNFVVVATGVVTADGSRIVSDPGQGLGKSGWFGQGFPLIPPTEIASQDPECGDDPGAQALAAEISAIVAEANTSIAEARTLVDQVNAAKVLFDVGFIAFVAGDCTACALSGLGCVLCNNLIQGLASASIPLGDPVGPAAIGATAAEAAAKYEKAATLAATASFLLDLAMIEVSLLGNLIVECNIPVELLLAKLETVSIARQKADQLALELDFSLLNDFILTPINVAEALISAIASLLGDILGGRVADGAYSPELLALIDELQALQPELDALFTQVQIEAEALSVLAAETQSAFVDAGNLLTNAGCVYLFGGQAALPTVTGDFVIPNVPTTGFPERLSGVCATADGLLFARSGFIAVQPGTNVLGELEYATEPFPETASLDVSLDAPLPLFAPDGFAGIVASATLSDGTLEGVSGPSDGVAYLTTDPATFSVTPTGFVGADSIGLGSVSARRDGVSASTIVSSTVDPFSPFGDYFNSDLVGLVVDVAGTPVVGATVATNYGLVEITQQGGAFKFSCHPTLSGPIDVQVTYDDEGDTLLGFALAIADSGSCSDPFLGVMSAGTIVIDRDSDGDGLPDWYETVLFGSDARLVDSDGDGLDDGLEILELGTSASSADSDADGLDDGFEVALGTSPTSVTPTTTVIGTVVDTVLQPVADAVASIVGPAGSPSAGTDAVGAFTLGPWPANIGPVTVLASKPSPDGQLDGTSGPVPTVANGITDVGPIVVSPSDDEPLFPVPAFAIESVNSESFDVADLDGDGFEDIVVGTYGSGGGRARVRFGSEDGQWAEGPVTTLSAGNAEAHVALADFDSDEVIDLAAASALPGVLDVFTGNGDGTFDLAAPVAIDQPDAMTVADVDTDGVPDVLVAASATLTVFRGYDPVGIFVTQESYALPFLFTQMLECIDVDNDGDLDVFARASDVAIALGTGDGTFAAPSIVDIDGTTPQVVGDITGDGLPDLVGFGDAAGSVAVYAGLGGAAFGGPVTSAFEGMTVSGLHAAGRLDAVGGDDVVARVFTDDLFLNGVATLLSDGGASLTMGILAPANVEAALVHDLDDDGVDDVLTRANEGVVLATHRNLGDGVVEGGIIATTSLRVDRLWAADFDGDGVGDIVGSSTGAAINALVVMLGGSGGLAEVSTVTLDSNTEDLDPADYDGDGVIDLIHASSDAVLLFRGIGDGTFEEGVVLVDGAAIDSVDVADVNGDGRPDVAAVVFTDVTVWFQDEFGVLSTSTSIAPCLTGFTFGDVAIADFNGDGNADVAFGNSQPGCVAFGDGLGGFSTVTSLGFGEMSTAFVTADLLGDESIDLVGAKLGSQLGPRVYSFDADGALSDFLEPSTTNSSRAVAIADIDGDGLDDLISLGSGVFDVWAGPGSVAGETARTFLISGLPLSLVAGDFDGDGDEDVATPMPGVTAIYIAPNGTVGSR